MNNEIMKSKVISNMPKNGAMDARPFFSKQGSDNLSAPDESNYFFQSKISAPTIQRSQLSDQAKTSWEQDKDKGKIFDLLRSVVPSNDFELFDYIKSIFPEGSDDLWLATTIFSHGPEPLWPGGHLAERQRRAVANNWAGSKARPRGHVVRRSS